MDIHGWHNWIQRPQKIILFSFKFYLLLLFGASDRIRNKPFWILSVECGLNGEQKKNWILDIILFMDHG